LFFHKISTVICRAVGKRHHFDQLPFHLLFLK
jgi:hypothetical protein